MKQQWQSYAQKYVALSTREQYLILISGLVVFIMVVYTFFIEGNLNLIEKQNQQIAQLTSENQTADASIAILKEALKKDPNLVIAKQISQYEKKLVGVDTALLKLTSGLIDPIQMRYALLELLNLQKGVTLVSFEVMPVVPLLMNNKGAKESEQREPLLNDNAKTGENSVSLGLYRHSIKLKLTGQYFHLRDYLAQLESLSWTFFWQKFQYQLVDYPLSELEVEIYSLSTEPEFIGI